MLHPVSVPVSLRAAKIPVDHLQRNLSWLLVWYQQLGRLSSPLQHDPSPVFFWAAGLFPVLINQLIKTSPKKTLLFSSPVVQYYLSLTGSPCMSLKLSSRSPCTTSKQSTWVPCMSLKQLTWYKVLGLASSRRTRCACPAPRTSSLLSGNIRILVIYTSF